MKTLTRLAVSLLLLALASNARAADPPAALAPAKAPADPMARLLPEVKFQGVALEDVIDFLQDVAPGFKAVVVREAGAPADYPQVTLKLRSVTLHQVWEVLQAAYPDVETQQMEGDKPGAIWLVRIHAPPAGAARAAAAGSGLRVYRLTPILDLQLSHMGKTRGGSGEVKEALNQVLSLIKAAMAQVPTKPNGEPLLQVHEETETLLFRGSAEQRAALEEALQALDPTISPQAAKMAHLSTELEAANQSARKAEDRARSLEVELAEVKQMLHDEQAKTLAQALEAEKLKVRLEETRKMAELRAVFGADDGGGTAGGASVHSPTTRPAPAGQ